MSSNETCYEDCGSDPCGKTAVALRHDPNFPGEPPYPVCVKHTRAPMAPLAVQHQAILAAAQEHGWTSEQVVAGMELAEAAEAWDCAVDYFASQPEDDNRSRSELNVANDRVEQALSDYRQARDAQEVQS